MQVNHPLCDFGLLRGKETLERRCVLIDRSRLWRGANLWGCAV